MQKISQTLVKYMYTNQKTYLYQSKLILVHFEFFTLHQGQLNFLFLFLYHIAYYLVSDQSLQFLRRSIFKLPPEYLSNIFFDDPKFNSLV